MRALFITTLSLLILLAGGNIYFQLQKLGGNDLLACDMPVVEYTTGNMDDTVEQFYSDSVEWVIENYFPYPARSGLPDQYDGWIVIIRMIADGDEDLEGFTMHPQDFAQVKLGNTWMLQEDFERMMCSREV